MIFTHNMACPIPWRQWDGYLLKVACTGHAMALHCTRFLNVFQWLQWNLNPEEEFNMQHLQFCQLPTRHVKVADSISWAFAVRSNLNEMITIPESLLKLLSHKYRDSSDNYFSTGQSKAYFLVQPYLKMTNTNKMFVDPMARGQTFKKNVKCVNL